MLKSLDNCVIIAEFCPVVSGCIVFAQEQNRTPTAKRNVTKTQQIGTCQIKKASAKQCKQPKE